jgi:phenolic acid decarboxylase
MRRLVYNSHIETEVEFSVLDDANCPRWVQDIKEDFHVDISYVQENIYRVRSTEDFSGSIVSRNFCYSHEIGAARALCVAFTLLW